jgi:hypothetical protein
LSSIEDSVDVDTILGQDVVYRKRESLRKRALKPAIGFMDASINPQRFDVSSKAVVVVNAEPWLL